MLQCDFHGLVWPLQLGMWTPKLWCGPSRWGYGLPHFGLASGVEDMDSQALVWPLNLGIWSPRLWCGPSSWGYGTLRIRCGPSSWGYGLPRFGVAPRVGDVDFHALV